MTSQYLWFLVFGIALYIIFTDENVAKAFFYVIELAKTNTRRWWWWTTHNPANPVVKYFMYRKNLKLAKDLREKINKHIEAQE